METYIDKTPEIVDLDKIFITLNVILHRVLYDNDVLAWNKKQGHFLIKSVFGFWLFWQLLSNQADYNPLTLPPSSPAADDIIHQERKTTIR